MKLLDRLLHRVKKLLDCLSHRSKPEAPPTPLNDQTLLTGATISRSIPIISREILVHQAGLEPATHGLEGRCSIL